MPRAIWSGAISFGLVNVPVKLYSATSHKEVHFHMLHQKDGARVKQKRVCSQEDVEIPWEEIAKGYEVSAGRYVMLTKEEIAALSPKADRTISIEDFVEESEIDPIYYESAYYLVPDRGAGRPYELLLEAMKRSRKVAIARVVLRTRQYLCAVRPMGRGLALSTMLYADEVNPMEQLEELPGPEAAPKERELEMAEQLIDSLTTKFEPDKYRDDYREQVLQLIERKSEGEEIVAPEVPEEPARVVNLMDALQASLRSLRKEGAEEARGERRAPAKAARTARAPEPPPSPKGGKSNSKKRKKSA